MDYDSMQFFNATLSFSSISHITIKIEKINKIHDILTTYRTRCKIADKLDNFCSWNNLFPPSVIPKNYSTEFIRGINDAIKLFRLLSYQIYPWFLSFFWFFFRVLSCFF